MSHIRSARPTNGPGGLEWTHPGHVIEVTDPQVATDLLRIPGGGFSEVIPGNDNEFSELDDSGFVTNPEPPKKRRGRTRRNVTPSTPIVESAHPHAQLASPIGVDVTGVPHAAQRTDNAGKTIAANPSSDGLDTPMVAPNAEAAEQNGARDAARAAIVQQ